MDPVWGGGSSPHPLEVPRRYHSHLRHLVPPYKASGVPEEGDGEGKEALLHQDVLTMATEELVTQGSGGDANHSGAVQEGEHKAATEGQPSGASEGQDTQGTQRQVGDTSQANGSEAITSDQHCELTGFQPPVCPQLPPALVCEAADADPASPVAPTDALPDDLLPCDSSLSAEDTIEGMPPSVQSELRPDTPDMESAEALFSLPGAVATSTPKVAKCEVKGRGASPAPQPPAHTHLPTVVAAMGSAPASPTVSPDTTTRHIRATATSSQPAALRMIAVQPQPVSMVGPASGLLPALKGFPVDTGGLDLLSNMAEQPFQHHVAHMGQQQPLGVAAGHSRDMLYMAHSHAEGGSSQAAALMPSTCRKQRHMSYTARMQEVMERFYDGNPYPNRQEKVTLGELLGLPADRVTVWFQNRRNKDRKKRKAEGLVKMDPRKRICPANLLTPQALTPESAALTNPWEHLGAKAAPNTPQPPHPQALYPQAAPSGGAVSAARLRWPNLTQQLASRGPVGYSTGPRLPVPLGAEGGGRGRGLAPLPLGYAPLARMAWQGGTNPPPPPLQHSYTLQPPTACRLQGQPLMAPYAQYSLYNTKDRPPLEQGRPAMVVNSSGFVQLLPCQPVYKAEARAAGMGQPPLAPHHSQHPGDLTGHRQHQLVANIAPFRKHDMDTKLTSPEVPQVASPETPNASCSTENNLHIDLAGSEGSEACEASEGGLHQAVWRPVDMGGGGGGHRPHHLSDISSQSEPDFPTPAPPSQVVKPATGVSPEPAVGCHGDSLAPPPAARAASQSSSLDQYTQWYTSQVQQRYKCGPEQPPPSTAPHTAWHTQAHDNIHTAPQYKQREHYFESAGRPIEYTPPLRPPTPGPPWGQCYEPAPDPGWPPADTAWQACPYSLQQGGTMAYHGNQAGVLGSPWTSQAPMSAGYGGLGGAAVTAACGVYSGGSAGTVSSAHRYAGQPGLPASTLPNPDTDLNNNDNDLQPSHKPTLGKYSAFWHPPGKDASQSFSSSASSSSSEDGGDDEEDSKARLSRTTSRDEEEESGNMPGGSVVGGSGPLVGGWAHSEPYVSSKVHHPAGHPAPPHLQPHDSYTVHHPAAAQAACPPDYNPNYLLDNYITIRPAPSSQGRDHQEVMRRSHPADQVYPDSGHTGDVSETAPGALCGVGPQCDMDGGGGWMGEQGISKADPDTCAQPHTWPSGSLPQGQV